MEKKIVTGLFLFLVVFALSSIFFYLRGEKDYFNKNGLVEQKDVVNVVVSRSTDMIDLFVKGTIDGFLMAHPIAADAVLNNEDAEYFIHSSEIWPNHPGSTLSAITEDEEIILALVWAHVKATQFINDSSNEKKIIEYGMDFTGQSENVIRESLKHTKHTEFPSQTATKEFLEIMIDEGVILNTPLEQGYASSDDFLNDFLNDYYYKDVIKNLENNPQWKPSFVEKSVKVGYVENVLTYMTAYVASKEGYYDEVFADIELIGFLNAPSTIDAYNAGLIDAAYSGIGGSITKVFNGELPIFIIGGGNAEGQSLVVRNNIKMKNDFIGRTIASDRPGTTPYFLLIPYTTLLFLFF